MRKLSTLAVPAALAVLALASSAGSFPSGGRIVFVTNHLCGGRQVDCGRAEIATVRDNGTGTVVLTRNAVSESSPAWSPNGRWITFASEGRLRANRLWRLTVATKKLVELTSGTPAALYPSWSPDSRRIAFTLGGKLAVMDATGSHRRVLPQFGTHPRFSPDGRWLVYVANGDLFKARLDGSGRTQLTHRGKQSTNDQPDW